MKKLTKKQGIFIGIIVAIILVVAIVLGVVFAGNGKDTKENHGPKTETITDAETDKDINNNIDNETKEENKTDTTEEDTQSDATDDTQGSKEEPVVTKTTMYAKSNVNVRSGAGTSNSQIGSLTKGQEVTKVGEENGWSKIEFNGGIGYVKSEYLSAEKVAVNNTTSNNTSNNNNQTGNNTNTTTPSKPDTPNVQEPEKSPYAGMYKPYDNASVERFNQCATILRGGMAGQYIQVTTTFIDYFSGAIILSNGNTDNAWMYVKIKYWSTNEGSTETAPAFDELPSLAKQCFVALAPEGGLDLYNKVNSLILQYGDPCDVPTQGTISESIPGLSVTLTQGKAGIEIRFWAE